MGSVLHNLLDINQTLVSKMRLYKHGKLHRNQVNGYLKGKRTLMEEETVEAKVFWCRYVKKFNPLFHEWYKQSTGSFYSEFIPDDIWYSKVDYFFNDKAAGEAIDNKCLYNLFFGGG